MKLIKIYSIEILAKTVDVHGFDSNGIHISFTVRFDHLSTYATTRGDEAIKKAVKVLLKKSYKNFKFKFND
jgi:hypothetical protein